MKKNLLSFSAVGKAKSPVPTEALLRIMWFFPSLFAHLPSMQIFNLGHVLLCSLYKNLW